MESLAKDIKPKIKKLDQEKKEVTVNSDETTCGTPDMNEISPEFKDNLEFPNIDNCDQKMQAEKKLEELDVVSIETNHLMDLIISRHPEKPIKSSEEHAIAQEAAKEDQIIEVRHIDFFLRDQPSILGVVCGWLKFKN